MVFFLVIADTDNNTVRDTDEQFEQTLKILLFVKNYIAVQYIPSVKCRKRSE